MPVVASGTYTLLGINADHVEVMQEAIRDYKEKVEEPLQKLSGNVEYTNAFKGSVIAETVRGYLEAVLAKLQAMLDYIDEFDASLTQVKINYEGQAESISSTVAQDADNVEGRDIKTTPGVKGYTPQGPGGGNPGGGDPNPGGNDDQNPGGNDDQNPGGNDDQNPGGNDDQNPSGDDDQNPGGDPAPDENYDFNDNGIDTGRIAGTESEAVAGDFIPEDHIYDPSFESDGVTFHEGENGGIRIDNDGVPIGWTDVIEDQNP